MGRHQSEPTAHPPSPLSIRRQTTSSTTRRYAHWLNVSRKLPTAVPPAAPAKSQQRLLVSPRQCNQETTATDENATNGTAVAVACLMLSVAPPVG